jgi:RNA polymerase sigma factor (sigma-70 family)
MVTGLHGDPAKRSGSHAKRVRAVAYVRMSTDLQEFSPENQLTAIMGYAEERGFDVVRVYDDAGRSGLRADNRPGHRRLMGEIESGRADFDAVITYDVSRWGRFQDADEPGYYEHICSRAGIQLHYCAEQFENDGSLTSNVVKSIKRLMAGEFSRELSKKVSAGRDLLIKKGFRQGGMAGYGLRRMLIDEHGNRKGELAFGERKSLQTDRVILVPGPSNEVETVRRIYKMFVNEGQTESEIAAILNQEKILTYLQRQWTYTTVRGVLTNPKYIGDNVSNRVATKLNQKRVANTPDKWVRAERIFEPIVDRELHYAARAIVEQRSRRLSNDQVLELLRGLLMEAGRLSCLIIDERESMLSSSAIADRFGSLHNAYKLVGYRSGRDHRYIEEKHAWQDIIARRAFNEYRPEELIAVYDTRSPDSDSEVVEEIQAYIILSIERVLDYFLGHGDLNNNVSERKHLARSSIYDALLDPMSQDGLSLRRYFRRTIHNRCVDALRKQLQYRRRFSVLESSDIDLADDHLDDDADGPYEGRSVPTEDRLNLEIDLKNMWLAIAHAGRRLTLEMLIKGYTQEEIALAAGVSDRQVRRWLKSLKDEASKKTDME